MYTHFVFFKEMDAFLDSTIILANISLTGLVPIPIKEFVVVVGGGSGTTLMEQVMSYPPPDHVQWYMNGSLVMSSDLYLISNISVSDNSTVPITYSASLTISSVNLTTQGFYLASFYGYVGVVNTSSIFVFWRCPMICTSSPTSLSLTTQLSPSPTVPLSPSVMWVWSTPPSLSYLGV